MATSYADSLQLLRDTADMARTAWLQRNRVERVLTQNAVARIAATPYFSSHATPLHDTSAMDGFIIESSTTMATSPTHPVTFRIVGRVVPGQFPKMYPDTCLGDDHVCLEVMTGGRFPSQEGKIGKLNACVPVEDVSVTTSTAQGSGHAASFIIVTKPVQPMAYRRVAGTDIPPNKLLIEPGQRILTSHILPLVSAGLHSVQAVAKPRIGIWSTGSEFVPGTCHRATDVNGPYLTAICQEFGADASFLGYLDDKRDELSREFRQVAESGNFDVLLTTGAVSAAGKYDFVRDALRALHANVLFHGLDIRPGHPALFALLPCNSEWVTFFGLPGNPGAASACFRFLVVPYLRRLLGREVEKPKRAKATSARLSSQGVDQRLKQVIFIAKQTSDCFVPGRMSTLSTGLNLVQVQDKTSPARMEPLIEANCWVHVRGGQNVTEGQVVDCYNMSLATE